MIILNSRQMIYVHLHKCGGTSIEASFEPAARWNDLILGSTPLGEVMQTHYARRFSLEKHSTATEIIAAVGEDLWNSYTTWTTVRSPYGRITSHYNYIASIAEPLIAGSSFPASASANEQKAWVESASYPKTKPWSYAGVKAYLSTRSSSRPFSEFIRHPAVLAATGYKPQFDQLSDPNTGKMLVADSVKLEQLNDRWVGICTNFRLPDLKLLTRNVTHKSFRKDSKELLSYRDDVDFINKKYKNDFKVFGYDMV